MNEIITKLNVAVVDDDPRIRALLDNELSDEGFNVVCCANAREMLEAVRSCNIELILLDLMMPEFDGIYCLNLLKSVPYEGTAVIVTSLSDDSKRREALQAGAKDYILKPDLFDKLPSLIEQYLSVN